MRDRTILTATLGPETAVFRRNGSSHVIAAKILGRVKDGPTESVYLDRLIHDASVKVEGWEVSGAISSILSRTVPAF